MSTGVKGQRNPNDSAESETSRQKKMKTIETYGSTGKPIMFHINWQTSLGITVYQFQVQRKLKIFAAGKKIKAIWLIVADETRLGKSSSTEFNWSKFFHTFPIVVVSRLKVFILKSATEEKKPSLVKFIISFFFPFSNFLSLSLPIGANSVWFIVTVNTRNFHIHIKSLCNALCAQHRVTMPRCQFERSSTDTFNI